MAHLRLPWRSSRLLSVSASGHVDIVSLASPREDRGQLGVSVASAADVDQDGADDVVVGARLADPGSAPRDVARAYVFSGRDGSALFELASPDEQARRQLRLRSGWRRWRPGGALRLHRRGLMREPGRQSPGRRIRLRLQRPRWASDRLHRVSRRGAERPDRHCRRWRRRSRWRRVGRCGRGRRLRRTLARVPRRRARLRFRRSERRATDRARFSERDIGRAVSAARCLAPATSASMVTGTCGSGRPARRLDRAGRVYVCSGKDCRPAVDARAART